MFIMALQCRGQRPPQINQRTLNRGSTLQKAHTIIYLIIWWRAKVFFVNKLECKLHLVFFSLFFPLKAFQADLKHCVHPAITHTYAWLCTHTHTHIEDNVFWHDRAGQTSDEWSPSLPGLIFSRLSRCLCAQINQAPCSNQSHLYLPANKWHCWEGEINRG